MDLAEQRLMQRLLTLVPESGWFCASAKHNGFSGVCKPPMAGLRDSSAGFGWPDVRTYVQNGENGLRRFLPVRL